MFDKLGSESNTQVKKQTVRHCHDKEIFESIDSKLRKFKIQPNEFIF